MQGMGVTNFIRKIKTRLERAIVDVAEQGAEQAEKRCPVAHADMRSTIRVETERSALGDEIVASVKVGGMHGSATGKFVDYAGFVEDGTERMSPEPFMRPAAMWVRSKGMRKLKQSLTANGIK